VTRERDFLSFARLVVAGRSDEVGRQLVSDPSLATHRATRGATRTDARRFFFTSIRHYLYAGDTALHLAAAAHHPDIAELLVAHGADVHGMNRMGATPLHYAADGNSAGPDGQARTIAYLLSAGADPNAINRLGVTPLHRAVRTRSSSAVKALLDGGADPRKKNSGGSTPLHLAVQATGNGGSGSERARHAQAEIIRMLLDAGATLTDRDARGRSVRECAAKHAQRAIESRR
jgi:ankyrin repeat protein